MKTKKLNLKLLPLLLAGLFMITACATPADDKNAANTVTTVDEVVVENDANEALTKAMEAEKAAVKVVTLEALNALFTADAKKFLKNVDFSQISAEAKKEYETALPASFKEGKKTVFDPKGGMKTIEVPEIQVTENLNEAIVSFKVTFGNGDIDAGNLGLIKTDGVWKILLNLVEEEK